MGVGVSANMSMCVCECGGACVCGRERVRASACLRAWVTVCGCVSVRVWVGEWVSGYVGEGVGVCVRGGRNH